MTDLVCLDLTSFIGLTLGFESENQVKLSEEEEYCCRLLPRLQAIFGHSTGFPQYMTELIGRQSYSRSLARNEKKLALCRLMVNIPQFT